MTTSGKEDIKTDDKFIIDFEAFEKSELSTSVLGARYCIALEFCHILLIMYHHLLDQVTLNHFFLIMTWQSLNFA